MKWSVGSTPIVEETFMDTQQIRQQTRTIAMVGASDKPARASYHVLEFLLQHGFTVYPVNPLLHGKQIHGQRVYASLADCPAPVDMVDIFRNTDDAAAVIDDAIALKGLLHIKTLWCQLGVVPVAAATRAETEGLRVVMDRCPAIEWR
jgi:predicted CoA-binding protein